MTEEEYERELRTQAMLERLCDCLRFVRTHCNYCGKAVCESCSSVFIDGELYCDDCYEYQKERL